MYVHVNANYILYKIGIGSQICEPSLNTIIVTKTLPHFMLNESCELQGHQVSDSIQL